MTSPSDTEMENRAAGTTFIQQRFHADCAVACLAMFLGVGYEEVAKHCHGRELVRDGGHIALPVPNR